MPQPIQGEQACNAGRPRRRWLNGRSGISPRRRRGSVGEIQAKAKAHLAGGGAVATLPNANRLWMLVGFDLFRRLSKEWECLEVYPQATVVVLGAGATHKHKQAGLQTQLRAGAKYTGWPKPPVLAALFDIGYGLAHDRLDGYLAAWMASLKLAEREPLGRPPSDAIWVPRFSALREI